MAMGNVFCLLIFFVIKVHRIYSRMQIKLSKGECILGIAQQHHQLIRVVFNSQIKVLKWNWPQQMPVQELDALLKLTEILTGAT